MPTLHRAHLQLAAADLQAWPEQARLPGRGGAQAGLQRAAQRRPRPQAGQRRHRGLAADGARQRGTSGGTLFRGGPLVWASSKFCENYLEILLTPLQLGSRVGVRGGGGGAGRAGDGGHARGARGVRHSQPGGHPHPVIRRHPRHVRQIRSHS